MANIAIDVVKIGGDSEIPSYCYSVKQKKPLTAKERKKHFSRYKSKRFGSSLYGGIPQKVKK